VAVEIVERMNMPNESLQYDFLYLNYGKILFLIFFIFALHLIFIHLAYAGIDTVCGGSKGYAYFFPVALSLLNKVKE
jgi:hypothetical protein